MTCLKQQEFSETSNMKIQCEKYRISIYKYCAGRFIFSLRIVSIAVAILFVTPVNSNASNARAFIADSDYVNYRHKLIGEALNDPIIKERLKNVQTPEELNAILSESVEGKLKIYREEHNLDENGASKKGGR